MSKKMIKRSLALGALMAFVITGSAFAEVVDTQYVQFKGEQKVASANEMDTVKDYITGYGERVLGGYRIVGDGVDTTKAIDTNVKVNSGEYNMVVGGNYSKATTIMSVSSTNVVVDGATVKQLVGGTGFSGIDANDVAEGRITNLTILSGNFGGEVDNTNCSEMLVAGGDLVKTSNATQTMKTIIDTANVAINGGNFNAAIYGGSIVERNYAGYTSGEMNSEVANAKVTINGGTFNDAIVAGGLAWGHKTSSVVENATLDITGGTFNNGADIFAGGLDGSNGAGFETAISKVHNANVTISNVIVNNIYGTSGNITFKNLGENYVMTHNNEVYGTKHDWVYSQNINNNLDADAIVNTTLKLTNVTADNVVVPKGTVTFRVEDSVDKKGEINIGQATGMTGLTVAEDGSVPVSVEANGEVNDAYAGDYKKMVEERFKVNGYKLFEEDEETGETTLNATSLTMEAGEVMGETTVDSIGNVTVKAHEGNGGISDISAVGLMAWRAETNDMNKRLGELRNANGEHGVWVRMVRGESEYNSVKNQYNQYQLGYDEKLSVDKSWTVGMALSYTDAESNFSQGNGKNTHKGLAIYGSKLNDDGSFIDWIAKYSRIEHDFDLDQYKGNYDTNGYSVSAEYGKRFQQGNGVWVEPQVELTYGQVESATYMVGGRTVNQDNMETLVGRVGFSLGKDISKGNVYARASYLYDFEGETEATYSKGSASDSFKQNLGGGWWEVGVGANINLSKATYIYADVEKTFGGEVDTNWQWNLGVRYSF